MLIYVKIWCFSYCLFINYDIVVVYIIWCECEVKVDLVISFDIDFKI